MNNNSNNNNYGYGNNYSQQPQQPQYTQPQYTVPAYSPQTGSKKSGVNLGTVLASIGAAAVIGLTSGYVGTKMAGGSAGETVLKADDGTSVVFQAIDRTSTQSSQSAYSVADVAAAVADSVVEITTEVVSTNGFMGQYISQGAGSGVIFTVDGYIMTNHHVIDGAQSITVTLRNGQSYPATLVGDDSQDDLALLKIEASGLTPAVLASENYNLRVGETAIAIGNPLGQLGGTVTSGIVSALDRQIEIDGEVMTLLQTSAAINPGNSGGGLFNDSGELIGIVNAKSSGSDIEGLGFAIPVNTVRTVFSDMMQYGYVKGRVSLGVSVISVTSRTAAWMYGVSEPGLYISKVETGSAAAKAGLESGDMIVSFDGVEVSSDSELSAAVKKHSVGDTVEMIIRRNGQDYRASITLEEYKG